MKIKISGLQKIIISRTDSIGDVVLTLPMAGVIKTLNPDCKIVFLGRNYTKAVIDACIHVDEFIPFEEFEGVSNKIAIQKLKDLGADGIIHVFPNHRIAYLAAMAAIPFRIGTYSRWYHIPYCNQLVYLTRKNSGKHEAQLNLRLLQTFGLKDDLALEKIPGYYGIEKVESLEENHAALLSKSKKNIILHPGSSGSAREWGLPNFKSLIELLKPEEYQIFLTGTESEGEQFRVTLSAPFKHVIDLSGKLTLAQLISFIKQSDALVAASTGPLHLAAALDIRAIGIYPPINPINAVRWAPLGKKATYLSSNDVNCNKCRNSNDCLCMTGIKPVEVLNLL